MNNADVSNLLASDLNSIAERTGWRPINEILPRPFVHVALLDMNSYQNCPDEMRDRCHNKAIGYMHEDRIQKYWQIKGERACAIAGYTHWMPLPEAPNYVNGRT